MERLVDINTFIKQVYEVEGVRIELTRRPGTVEHLVREYNYERLPDDATVDDLYYRINRCVNRPFLYSFSIER